MILRIRFIYLLLENFIYAYNDQVHPPFPPF